MQEDTFLVAALPVLAEKEAFRHFLEVVLVKEVALVVSLAQPPQPMLADNGFVELYVDLGAVNAVAFVFLEFLAVDVVNFNESEVFFNEIFKFELYFWRVH